MYAAAAIARRGRLSLLLLPPRLLRTQTQSRFSSATAAGSGGEDAYLEAWQRRQIQPQAVYEAEGRHRRWFYHVDLQVGVDGLPVDPTLLVCPGQPRTSIVAALLVVHRSYTPQQTHRHEHNVLVLHPCGETSHHYHKGPAIFGRAAEEGPDLLPQERQGQTDGRSINQPTNQFDRSACTITHPHPDDDSSSTSSSPRSGATTRASTPLTPSSAPVGVR